MSPLVVPRAIGFTTLVTLALITLLQILYLGVKWTANASPSSLNSREYSYVADDFPTELPIVPRKVALLFNATDRYRVDAEDDWASVIPRGGGWVHLGPDSRPFAVSMYHQLHCVNGIRRTIMASHKNDQNATSHTNHCFNYLREMILCRADITLEPTRLVLRPNGKMGEAASGENVTHICRDWTQVRSFLEEEYDQRISVPRS